MGRKHAGLKWRLIIGFANNRVRLVQLCRRVKQPFAGKSDFMFDNLLKLKISVLRDAITELKKENRGRKTKRCSNCRFAKKELRAWKINYYCCENSEKYNQSKFDDGEFTIQDAIKKANDVCKYHKLRTVNKEDKGEKLKTKKL